jgi:hypothetical protein
MSLNFHLYFNSISTGPSQRFHRFYVILLEKALILAIKTKYIPLKCPLEKFRTAEWSLKSLLFDARWQWF